MDQIYSMLMSIFTAVSGWFTNIMTQTGAGDMYIAFVFIAFACGFLLSNFGIGFRVGSDTAARTFKRRKEDI